MTTKTDRQKRQRMAALWMAYGLMFSVALIFRWEANATLQRIEDETCVAAIGPLLNLDADEIQQYADLNSFDDVLTIVDLVEERCEVMLGVDIQFKPIEEFCDDPRNHC